MAQVLSEETASADPFTQFQLWYDEAKGQPEPTAMTLTTAQPIDAKRRNGLCRPSSRMVLLKEHGSHGFVFYTNYDSRKGRDIDSNPEVALLFFWPLLQRQIRIEGHAQKTSREDSAEYFRTRARASQVGAWASNQDAVITRAELEARVAELEAEYAGREVPVPPYWGGYRVTPAVFEFWQGREHRLHDRLRYTLHEGAWRIERLSP